VADLTLENRLLKKTYGAPRSQVVSTSWPNQSASTYPVSGSILPAKMEIRASWS
jgi:hypothetical protein